MAGRVPVIGGSGSNCTGESLRKSLELQKLGVDGLLVISPYYNKSNEEGIYHHLADVMDAVNVPCILYNIPGRTGCSISPANVERLSRHPNAWGIKEASGNISYAADIAHCLSDDFHMMSGNDDMVVPLMTLRPPATLRSTTSNSSTPSSARSTPSRSRPPWPRWACSRRTTESRCGPWPTPIASASTRP